ncbi:HAD-IIIC family phosphatase [Chitinophaga polysaccharea]|uniref:HAD-IIIC family phosphatase n=1 Tax=Chitinophaga TaxID=79328 RepID=UPI001455963C|nr:MULTISPECIES: HAD-IIIC family phosphatase [Chitinophaga]NLR57667.1 HAD-IIIC family phosphatase [Chitinophaga polysaccharea]NLU93259.1 HAD-IIIC family phosphatase [Chitinophaga sp. Ak27]
MKDIKCVIWDLDNTIWEGTLLEDKTVTLRDGIREVLEELDNRGILHSVASKNNYEEAVGKLEELGIAHYFLFPQVSWNAKSHAVSTIQEQLNLGADTFLFIDDQPFEREEVKNVHPKISCIDAAEFRLLLTDKRLQPKFITTDSRRRRFMYLEAAERNRQEEAFRGPKEQFLAQLNMELLISPATEEDLERAEELTLRTNQYNATGTIYSYEELNYFRISPDHDLLVCELTDKFGSYGKIGLALVEKQSSYWHLRMILISCRVISHGIGTVLLNYILNQAFQTGKKVRADFQQTDRNRMMYLTFKFAGFTVLTNEAGLILFENEAAQLLKLPGYIKITDHQLISKWK